jgi:hypothetical protein
MFALRSGAGAVAVQPLRPRTPSSSRSRRRSGGRFRRSSGQPRRPTASLSRLPCPGASTTRWAASANAVAVVLPGTHAEVSSLTLDWCSTGGASARRGLKRVTAQDNEERAVGPPACREHRFRSKREPERHEPGRSRLLHLLNAAGPARAGRAAGGRPQQEPASRWSDLMLPDLDAKALSPAPIRPAAVGIPWLSDSRTSADERAITVRPEQRRDQRLRRVVLTHGKQAPLPCSAKTGALPWVAERPLFGRTIFSSRL